MNAIVRDGWVLVDDHPAICGAVARDIASTPNSKAVQIDIFLRVGPDRILVESFGGFGKTEDAAIADGFQSFVLNSFHVLLAAFYHSEDDHQVETEYWNINGQSRRVTIGRINSRGLPPNYDEPPTEWFNTLAEQIEKSALPGGTHWVRCFYGQYQFEQSAIEVLLDNDEWVDVQTEMAKVDWPKCEEYYSVRVFLIIQDREE
ncbi:DUF6348 family protein [Thalassoglobus sp. JC818]|uniref:DUF6348 family protein n=1 Tax=Thalassoglobus sp. JC818 TaxID=3232136 RepID=UPI00345A09BE